MADALTSASLASGSAAQPEPANLPPAKTVDAAGAPQQIVPDVDLKHPAVDDNPRADTTVTMNQIDFNDPTVSGADAVAANLKAQGSNIASGKPPKA